MSIEAIIAIVIPVMTGLIVLLYYHPTEGFKLVGGILKCLAAVLVLACAFQIGIIVENSRLSIEAQKSNIFLSRKEYMNEIVIFAVCIISGYMILFALAKFFKELQENKEKKVKKQP